MKYLYLNGKSYLYKRRIPYSKKFYTFNTKTKNAKKAHRISLLFNKLSYNLFEYIKAQGKDMALDYQEAYTILEAYKKKALNEEDNDLEKARHKHLSKLFDIKVENPILGTIRLDGASPKVIKPAIETFETLAHCSMMDYKKQIIKIGKQLVKRGTPEIKHIFSKVRNDDEALLSFLQLLLKAEGEILQVDYERAIDRFGLGQKKMNSATTQTQVQETSFIETQQRNYIPLEELVDDFLFSSSECDYKREDLKESKKQCYKMNKIITVLLDYLYHKNGKATSGDITLQVISEIFDIIPNIPKKQGSTNSAYPYYEFYLKAKEKQKKDDKEYEKRSISTIETDLLNFNRFIKYIEKKGYLTANELKQAQQNYQNIKKRIASAVMSGDINDEEDSEPFKNEMLQCLFSPKNNPYKQIIDVLLEKKKLMPNQSIDNYWARYFLPLIMLFTGARPSELAFLKISNCEIKTFDDNSERVILFIEKKVKTKLSRRIILIHDFLSNELGLIKFIKKAQKEERKYLFNTEKNIAILVGQAFNRPTIKENCIYPYITKEDEFKRSKYTLYSLRHNYKTHMLYKKYDAALIHKIQGHKDENVSSTYISTYSDELIKFVNDFDLYKIIDWTEFKKVSEKI